MGTVHGAPLEGTASKELKPGGAWYSPQFSLVAALFLLSPTVVNLLYNQGKSG
jgi:hypothetical protein